MAAQSKKNVRSYKKPVAKRVSIQRPEAKQQVEQADILPDGFTRISEVKIRKVYR
jgi:hypothetical protein